MLLSTLADRGAAPALVKTLVFNQTRLSMIAENVANLHTPGYRAKQLDVKGFQGALRKALDARGSDFKKPFLVNAGPEVRTDRLGWLDVAPSEKPVENILFHDGTNTSLERQMSNLAETGMMHEFATRVLQGYYDAARKAIRGTLG